MASPHRPVTSPGYLKWLIAAGLLEGTSTLALAVAMIFKYLIVHPDGAAATSMFGRIHGGLFVVYVLMLFVGFVIVPLTPRLLGLGIVGAIVPFGPFIYDVALLRLLRSGDRS